MQVKKNTVSSIMTYQISVNWLYSFCYKMLLKQFCDHLTEMLMAIHLTLFTGKHNIKTNSAKKYMQGCVCMSYG